MLLSFIASMSAVAFAMQDHFRPRDVIVHNAIASQDLSSTAELSKRSFLPNFKHFLFGKRSLIKACTQNQIVIVMQCLSAGVDPSAYGNQAIQMASEQGHVDVVKVLLQDERVDPSANDNYAIQIASACGHVAVVRVLLQDERVDPSVNDNYAIRVASEQGHVDVVKLLLEDERVDPSANSNYAIRLASEQGFVDVVKLLLEDERVDPSADDNYAIRWASRRGNWHVVEMLVEDARTDLKILVSSGFFNQNSIPAPHIVSSFCRRYAMHLPLIQKAVVYFQRYCQTQAAQMLMQFIMDKNWIGTQRLMQLLSKRFIGFAKQIEDWYLHHSYKPGGPGYERAKISWNS